MSKNFLGGINQCFRIIKAWKIFLQKKEISLFSVGNFFSHSAEKFCGGNRSRFQKFLGMENFMQKMGISLFSVENLLSHTAEKNRRETILCLKENVVSKIFMHRSWGGARYGNPPVFRKNSGIVKF